MFVTTQAGEKLRLSGEDAFLLGQPKPGNLQILAYGSADAKLRFWDQTTLLKTTFSSPPPIGDVAPNTGQFLTIINTQGAIEFRGATIGTAAQPWIGPDSVGGIAINTPTGKQLLFTINNAAKLTMLATGLFQLSAYGAGIAQFDSSGNLTSKTKPVSASAAGGSNVSTTSASMSDVTGMSVTMTTSGGNVLVSVSFPMKCAANTGLTTLNLDGVDGNVLSTTNLTTDQTISFSVLYTGLAAGSHTWKLRYRNNDGASSIQMNMSSVANGLINAIELPS